MLSNVAGGKWGHLPQGAGLGGASTHFIQTFKKCVFQQNLGQNMLKKLIFLKKAVRSPQCQGIRPPKPR